MKYFEERLGTIGKSVTELEDKVREMRREVESAARNAEKVCPRIDTERSRKNIESKINKLKAHIAQELPNREEQERIKQKYVEAYQHFKDTKKAIENERLALKVCKLIHPHKWMSNLYTLLQKLKDSLKWRKNKYQELQERIAHRAQVFFTHFLHQRDFDGKMKFNHEKERLEISVNVDRHTDESKSTRNTKALSGGERSFTTVCFIMSLWEAMEAPFRCLDEFDVFMASFKRQVATVQCGDHTCTLS